MTEQELIELAEGVASLRIVVENLGAMNRPTDPDKRVKMDAAYMIARDKLAILERGYQAGLRLLVGSKP